MRLAWPAIGVVAAVVATFAQSMWIWAPAWVMVWVAFWGWFFARDRHRESRKVASRIANQGSAAGSSNPVATSVAYEPVIHNCRDGTPNQ